MNSKTIEKSIADAPVEVRKTLAAHCEAVYRVRKSEQQIQLWRRELEIAEKEFEFTFTEYTEALNRLNFETNTMKPNERMELDL